MIEIKRVEENDGEVWYHAEISTRINGGEPSVAYTNQFNSIDESVQWVLGTVEDADFERIG
jgi:hypothetical protein